MGVLSSYTGVAAGAYDFKDTGTTARNTASARALISMGEIGGGVKLTWKLQARGTASCAAAYPPPN